MTINIPDNFSIMPNDLLGFISDKAVSVFLKICQCHSMLENVPFDGMEWIKLSSAYLSKTLYKDNKTINTALNELVGIGIVQTTRQNRKKILFRVNWNETSILCDILSQLNDIGRNKVWNLCFGGNVTPISKVPPEKLKPILAKFPAAPCKGKNSSYMDTFKDFLLYNNENHGNFDNIPINLRCEDWQGEWDIKLSIKRKTKE